MEFDETGDVSKSQDRASRDPDGGVWTESDPGDPRSLGAELGAALGAKRERGLETRRHKAMIAAALFDEPPTPVKIGRFTIVRELGAGGMGVVYVAYDEQLDRKVAVKLLRGADPSSIAQARLEREAQAMARLSHPNVVTVHEVGKFEGQVFVAMEFVEGVDLRGWLREAAEPRGWRAILDLFIQAGEGLAAAHDKGIVHRDFKPDNVLVGQDGRVRVADFGLAHAFDQVLADDEERAELGESHSSSSGSARLGTSLTRTGAIMGTPAYMAPEQYLGKRTDARSDQFSFCVAVWEGLYGRRPFAGTNLAALSVEITEGRISPPPEGAAVPPWLSAVLIQGLAVEPDARWPSMRELLDTLARDPEARRRKLALGLAAAAAGLGLVAGLTWLSATKIRDDASQHYWNGFTAQLLEIERERGLAQANDDARSARDATRMSVYRSYRPKQGVIDHEDPMVAAALLREVEGPTRRSSEWISAANEILGRPMSYAVLEGHADAVSALAFSPDGAWLYSASFDGDVRRWALGADQSEVIGEHDKQVHNLALSPDGARLVSSSDDGSVRLWSPSSPSQVLIRHAGPVMQAGFDAKGERVVSASKDGTARIHAIASGREIVLEGHEGAVLAAAFDPSGERVLTGSADCSARLWRARDGALLATLEDHTKAVYHVRWLPDGRALTGSDDGGVWVYDVARSPARGVELTRHPSSITAIDVEAPWVASVGLEGSVHVSSVDPSRPTVKLPDHADAVWSVALVPGGEEVVSVGFDAGVRLARADGRGVPRWFMGHRVALLPAAIDGAGRWLATGSYDGSIRLWRLDPRRLEIPLEGHTDKLYSVAVDASGERLATTSHDGSARVWDARDGTALAAFDGGDDMVMRAAFSPDGRTLATGRYAGLAELWTIDSGERRVLEGHGHVVWWVAWDAGGARLATASYDGSVRVWDVEHGEEALVLEGHGDRVVYVDFDPVSGRLLSAGEDGSVRLWDASTGALERALVAHDAGIKVVARSADARALAAGANDGAVVLWPDLASGSPEVLAAHTKALTSLSFDASGERLLTASLDHDAKVWRVRDGVLLHTLAGHSDEIWSAAFVAGDRVVTGSNDNTLRIWSLADAGPPLVLTGHRQGIADLEVFADGQRLVSVSNDASAKIWLLDALIDDPDRLVDQLWSVTSFCVPVDSRVRELGERRREAEAAHARCRSRQR